MEQVSEVARDECPLCKITKIIDNGVYHKHINKEYKYKTGTHRFKPISRAVAILKYGFDIEKEKYV